MEQPEDSPATPEDFGLSPEEEAEMVEAALWAEFDEASGGKPHPTLRPDAYVVIPPPAEPEVEAEG